MSVVAAPLILAACANPLEPYEDSDMIGPGRGTDDYKLSPCACEPVELPGVTQDTLDALKAIYG